MSALPVSMYRYAQLSLLLYLYQLGSNMALRCQPTCINYNYEQTTIVRCTLYHMQAIVVVITLPDSECLYQLMACELTQAQGYGLFQLYSSVSHTRIIIFIIPSKPNPTQSGYKSGQPIFYIFCLTFISF